MMFMTFMHVFDNNDRLIHKTTYTKLTKFRQEMLIISDTAHCQVYLKTSNLCNSRVKALSFIYSRCGLQYADAKCSAINSFLLAAL